MAVGFLLFYKLDKRDFTKLSFCKDLHALISSKLLVIIAMGVTALPSPAYLFVVKPS